MIKLLQLIEERQSVRKFDLSKTVEKEKIIQCVEAARLAPSACNAQPWKFIVIDEPELRKNVAEQTYGPFMKFNKFVIEAPVIVVVTIEKQNFNSRFGSSYKNIDFPLIDIGIASQQFCLQAQELGLGTCMLGWFNEKPIQKLLNIPKQRKIGMLIALGYAVENYKHRIKQRKNFEQMCSFNTYE